MTHRDREVFLQLVRPSLSNTERSRERTGIIGRSVRGITPRDRSTAMSISTHRLGDVRRSWAAWAMARGDDVIVADTMINWARDASSSATAHKRLSVGRRFAV